MRFVLFQQHVFGSGALDSGKAFPQSACMAFLSHLYCQRFGDCVGIFNFIDVLGNPNVCTPTLILCRLPCDR